jgi:hypothetical protein
MLRLIAPTARTPAQVPECPNRHDYELALTSKDDTDIEYHSDNETGVADGTFCSGMSSVRASISRLAKRTKQSNTEKNIDAVNGNRESMRKRISEAFEEVRQRGVSGTDGNAACLRHCGTSCASVAWQSFCACVAIAGALWAAFVALSWFEIIGISSMPPGIKYGAKVGDVYRA